MIAGKGRPEILFWLGKYDQIDNAMGCAYDFVRIPFLRRDPRSAIGESCRRQSIAYEVTTS